MPFGNPCQIAVVAKCYAVPVDTTVGLRERKKLRTRAELSDAAFRLFAERGFDETTIEDIVEQVEVSPRTFFRYFDSKEDVVIGFFDDMGLELRAMLAERPPDEPPFTALRGALGSLIDLYEEQADRVMAAKRLAHDTPAIRARLLDKHARWENGVTEELSARLGVDPCRGPATEVDRRRRARRVLDGRDRVVLERRQGRSAPARRRRPRDGLRRVRRQLSLSRPAPKAVESGRPRSS